MPTEGVIRFRYRLSEPGDGDDVPRLLLAEVNAVRRVLRALGLLGRDATRYDGFGFGNLSVRLPGRREFHVTASQTGGLDDLAAEHVCRVDDWDLPAFHISATGTRPPSSEALTHAIIHGSDDAARWILHVHDPAIWQSADRLRLPATAADVGYGSPAMAAGVRALLHAHAQRPLVFVTPGHADGVFALGSDAAQVTAALVAVLVRAHLPS